jgi:hypothetical protein
MPYHTVDPFKKSNKYKSIGNRSKNDLVIKNKRKNKYLKDHKNKQYKFDGYVIKQQIKDYKKSKGVSFEFENNNKNNNLILSLESQKETTVIEIPIPPEVFNTIIENEFDYSIPAILLI